MDTQTNVGTATRFRHQGEAFIGAHPRGLVVRERDGAAGYIDADTGEFLILFGPGAPSAEGNTADEPSTADALAALAILAALVAVLLLSAAIWTAQGWTISAKLGLEAVVLLVVGSGLMAARG